MTEAKHYEFKAEIKKLLNILSKSLYQHEEIFLRELISNCADALKKMHLISLKNKDDLENPDLDLKIDVKFNSKEKILTVCDTGIGMEKDNLIENIGTIAGSGTEKFLANLAKGQDDKSIDLDIIGQFGIGFYSVFMVTDKVEIITKSYQKDAQAYRWVSDGSGKFDIFEFEKEQRGTDVIVHLHDDLVEKYLQQNKIESIIKKYSNFIRFPIFVHDETKKDITDEIEDDEEEEEIIEDAKVVDVELDSEDEKDGKDEKSKEDKDKDKIKEEEEEEDNEPKPVNEINPLWKRRKSEITDEQYKDFYHFIAKKYDNYQHVINYKAEGIVQFKSILFIPESRPQNLMNQEFSYGPALYSKNIMIMEKCEELMPQWMRFVYGIVDSEDIPLNISRDTIQTNRVIIKLENLIVKKFLKEMKKIQNKEPEKFKKIWANFGDLIKEGIVSDHPRQEKLMKLLQVKTSKTKGDEMISLEEYIKRMPEGQDEIYYLTGENLRTMKLSPHLGYYKQHNHEVIFFDSPIDNFLMMNVHDFKTSTGEGEDKEDKSFQFKPIDVTEKKVEEESKDDKEKGEEDKSEEDENIPESTKKFLEFVKITLGDKIVDAKISDRLYGNASRLANPAGGMTSSMQRAMRYWTQSSMGKDFQIPRKIMEFNPDHPIVKSLIENHEKDSENGKLVPIINQLFENSLLAEGDLPNPSTMVPRLNQLIEMLITGNDDVKNVADEESEEKSEEESEEKSEEESEEKSEEESEEKSEEKSEEESEEE